MYMSLTRHSQIYAERILGVKGFPEVAQPSQRLRQYAGYLVIFDNCTVARDKVSFAARDSLAGSPEKGAGAEGFGHW